MTTTWVPVENGCPVAHLGRNLEVYGDELTIMDSNNLATAQAGPAIRRKLGSIVGRPVVIEIAAVPHGQIFMPPLAALEKVAEQKGAQR